MSMNTRAFEVSGMTCGNCENAVKQELAELDGISSVEVSAQTGDLRVTLTEASSVTNEAIIAAVDEAGYAAVAV